MIKFKRILSVCAATVVGFPAVAYQFSPHPCGEKIGAPASAEHVAALSDDLLAYFSDRHEGPAFAILLSCGSGRGLVVQSRGTSAPIQATDVVSEFQDKHCSVEETNFKALAQEFQQKGFQTHIRMTGMAGRFPFACVCDAQKQGLHKKTVWKLTDSGLHPTMDSVGNAVRCEEHGVKQ